MTDALAKKIAEKVFRFMRNCRCKKCFRFRWQCEECDLCRERIVSAIWAELGR
jgi:hypothetical protein